MSKDIATAQPGLQRCLSAVATPWKSTSLARRLQTVHLRSSPAGSRQIPATAGKEPGLASPASPDPITSPGTRPRAGPRADLPPRPSYRARLAPGLPGQGTPASALVEMGLARRPLSRASPGCPPAATALFHCSTRVLIPTPKYSHNTKSR